MSDIIENIKDAINPSRRDSATVETYDPQKRGPYADKSSAGDGQPELKPPASSEAQDPGRAEQTDLSGGGGSITSQGVNTGSESGKKTTSGTGFGAPQGTYGPHKSRVGNALDPRVDSDRDGRPNYGLSDYGEGAAKPVHEGKNYGLS
ncbi:hypothetical protein N656DRAFT_785443 [Canariomyces notabilis]|uniref:Uncharacterized protein n=1 Tax=Canariomyces notabilis TaxID=2074819 RepID=A0AAN6QBT1_9PEZI|nr:hypothetical protein N656DRAFT_785443 [Canariomyces arenarius]